MKVLFLFSFIALTPLISKGQFEFKSDSSSISFLTDQLEGTELGLPNFDSIAFELRFWATGELGGFVQLTFSQDSTWNYRRGFLNDQFELNILELPSEPNITSVWERLVTNNVLELPNQNELIYTYHKDGRTIKLGPENEETERLIHSTLDASAYTVQLFTAGKFRTYYYYNPIALNEHFQNSEWESIETEMFANIVKTISDSFNMMEVYRTHMRDKMGKN